MTVSGLCVFGCAWTGCSPDGVGQPPPQGVPRVAQSDAPAASADPLKERDVLRVLTSNNAHCYYRYRGEPRGFEHDLARAFAAFMGMEVEFLTPPWADLLDELVKGKGDLVAASLSVLPGRAAKAAFCEPYLDVRQHVVTRKDWEGLQDVADLAGRRIHVRADTSYAKRLRELQQEGIALEIVTHADVPTAELLRRVAEAEIDITLADTNVAHLGRRYHPNLRIALDVTEADRIAWAVRKDDVALREQVNAFFTQILNDGTFEKIYNDYYASVELFDPVDLTRFQERVETRLPLYIETLKAEAAKYDFDWRLLAAMMYQESHYDPNAKSHTGVRGLMQLTQSTAKELGVTYRLDPVQSIRGGVKYLGRICGQFEELDARNQILFAIASYNVGRGHVLDAQALARKQGLDPLQWESMKETLPLLADKKYHADSRYGYCRGSEPVRHIERILVYYDVLANRDREIGFVE